jgi:hypothetical protein
MKKLQSVLAVVFMVTLFACPVAADTITAITLAGGNVVGTNWVNNGNAWTTINNGWFVLGVSATATGSLVNNSNTTISVPFDHDYWLYAADIGVTSTSGNPKVEVTTVALGTFSTIFTVNGGYGSGMSFSYLSGSPLLQLGWASGTADKVGYNQQMTPNGQNDIYLHLQAGSPSPVPETATMLLLGSGLMGLAWFRRRFKKQG